MIVCSKCHKRLNPQDPQWQKHPFGIHYCWEYDLDNNWYHNCDPNAPREHKRYGCGIDTEDINKEDEMYDQ